MTNDIVVVVGFVVLVMAMCKVWNMYAMKQYNKLREKKLSMTYGFYVNNMEKPQLAGVGNDGNGDYDVAKAIQKIDLPDDIRIKLK